MEINEDALRPMTPETPDLGGWNWGAAFLSIPWGIGNGSYLTLLSLVPVLNIFWWIVCGIKGNKWAWESGLFPDAETFRVTQRTWNRAGIAMLVLIAAGVVLYLAAGMSMIGMFSDAMSQM